MEVKFTPDGWADYTYWQEQDRKTIKCINLLIQDITRNRYDGIGKPEPLQEILFGYWSRRIDDSSRLIYRLMENETII